MIPRIPRIPRISRISRISKISRIPRIPKIPRIPRIPGPIFGDFLTHAQYFIYFFSGAGFGSIYSNDACF